MEFVVDRKIMINFLKRFITKGRFTINGKDQPNITHAIIKVADNQIRLLSNDITNICHVRGTLDADVISEGEELISDLEKMLKIISSYKGSDVNISNTTTELTIACDKDKESFAHSSMIGDADIDAWDSDNVSDEHGVRYKDDEGVEYEYILWATFPNNTELKTVQKVFIDRIGIDEIHAEPDSEGIILKGRKNRSRDMFVPCQVSNEAIYKIKHLFPVFNSIVGKTEIFFRELEDNNQRNYWVRNAEIEWQVKIVRD